MSPQRALEQIYALFANEAPPQSIEDLRHELGVVESFRLLNTPLQRIAPQTLSSYAALALVTVGSAADFRYFLPRILEIAYTERYWWPDIELILGKLPQADWQSWEQEKIAGLEAFFAAVFSELLASPYTNGRQINSWLCAFARAGLPIGPFLYQLETAPERGKLIRFYEEHSPRLRHGKLSNEYWSDCPAAMRAVIAWFDSEPMQQRIMQAYLQES